MPSTSWPTETNAAGKWSAIVLIPRTNLSQLSLSIAVAAAVGIVIAAGGGVVVAVVAIAVAHFAFSFDCVLLAIEVLPQQESPRRLLYCYCE